MVSTAGKWQQVPGTEYAKSETGYIRELWPKTRYQVGPDNRLVTVGNWRKVAGASRYEVSDDGRVWAEGTPRGPLGRFLRFHTEDGRSPVVQIYADDGNKYVKRVADLVARAFIGPKPKGMRVLHRNNDLGDNHATNLFYGSPKEQGALAVEHGTHAHGERHGKAKLTAADVASIRKMCGTAREIAAKFGVSRSTIAAVLSGQNWKADAN